MSEYNANDHLHNVTASIQQLTYQAQGVQDITGANVADYEEISPDAASSVTLSNARPGVPFEMLVNNFPPTQPGTGTPASDNVRPMTAYSQSVVHDGDAETYKKVFDAPVYGGYYDWLTGKLYSDIVRVQAPIEGWVESQNPGVYTNSTGLADIWDSASGTRFSAGENVNVLFGGLSSATGPERMVLQSLEGKTLIYKPPETVESAEALGVYLTENPIYFYYRVKTPVEVEYDPKIIYTQGSNYAVSADFGTLTVKYQGIAPDEP